MSLRSLLLGSAIALSGVRAMLVVPEVDSESFAIPGDISNLHPIEAQAAQQQQVDLLCTECPFSIQSGAEAVLSLQFSIDDGLLMANDRQIFPPAPPGPITAVQRRPYDGEESEPIPMGYAVEIMPIPSPPEEPFDMVEVRFTVLDLDGYPVPVDTVAITLIHDAAGTLYMAGTNTEETADRASWRKCGGKPKCLRRFLFHRIRTMFAAAKERFMKMFKAKGCSGVAAPPPFPASHHDESGGNRFPGEHSSAGDDKGHHHNQGYHPHPHHGYKNKFHKTWERTMHRVVRFIVVPALLGVLAGVAASSIGMLVGQLVVFMWHRYRHSGRKEAVEEGSASEKEGLMTKSADDIPPAYADEEASVQEADDRA